jgi:hypothetical protein
VPSLNFHPTFVFTVDWFKTATASVILQGVSGEVLTTKLAPCPALRTRVLEMVLHQNTWYLRPAFIGAGNGVMFACVKMSLEFSQLSRPLAAFFMVNAIHHGAHYGFFRVRVWINLRIVQCQSVLRTSIEPLTGDVENEADWHLVHLFCGDVKCKILATFTRTV